MPPLGVTVCPRHGSLFLRKVSRGLCGVAGRTRAASGDRDPRNLLSKQPAAEPWPRPLPASRLQPLSCGCQDRLPQRLWGGFPIKALGSGGPLCSSDSRHPSASHLEHVDPGGPLGSSTHSFPGTRSLRDLLSSLLGRLTTLRFAIVSPETVTMHVSVVGDFELGRGKERPRVHLGAPGGTPVHGPIDTARACPVSSVQVEDGGAESCRWPRGRERVSVRDQGPPSSVGPNGP